MRPRVLMAVDVKPDTGGVSEHADQIARHLRQQGVEVEMMWRRRPKNLRLPGGLDTLVFSLAIARRCRRRSYDILHTHSSSGFLAQSLAPRRTARVATCHGDERESWRVERQLQRQGLHHIPLWSRVLVPLTRLPLFTRVVRDADVMIVLHAEEAERLSRERETASPGSVVVIPNGCSPPTRRPRPEPGHLVFMGEWYWKKGPEQLLEAYRAIRAESGEVRLTLLGADSDALACFTAADRASVKATGWLDKHGVEDVLSQADVLLITSVFEGMPIAGFEAMAWGIPVVGYDVPGVRACVGNAGRLAPPGRPDHLARVVLELVQCRRARERASAAAFSRAAAHSWAHVAQATLAAYELAQQLRSQAPQG
jgi:glycosyltransferase involved in cell wall biosynthesis